MKVSGVLRLLFGGHVRLDELYLCLELFLSFFFMLYIGVFGTNEYTETTDVFNTRIRTTKRLEKCIKKSHITTLRLIIYLYTSFPLILLEN